jgi:5-(carboxyamino)imidazole ribonucleotide synthase
MRAILNLPLGSTEMIQPSVMVNLLGEKDHFGTVQYEGLTDIINWAGVYPHLYGKSETKPFRKMGHVTIS